VLSELDLCSFPTRRSSDLASERFFLEGRYSSGLVSRRRVFINLLTVVDKVVLEVVDKLYRSVEHAAVGTSVHKDRLRAEHLGNRSEEHTSELQSRFDLVSR